MSTVYFVTSNEGKVRNARRTLKKFGISVKQVRADLAESRAEDPADIALEKARQAYALVKKPIIVEDSGFFIKALGGFPMTHIKFSLQTLGTKNILRALKGVKDRAAEWRMTLAYVSGPSTYKTFTFIEKGVLAKSLRPVKREMMSDYWRIYIPTDLKGNTHALCEMTGDELDAWHDHFTSHNQFEQFGRWYTSQKK